jgi:hypothetical protein
MSRLTDAHALVLMVTDLGMLRQRSLLWLASSKQFLTKYVQVCFVHSLDEQFPTCKTIFMTSSSTSPILWFTLMPREKVPKCVRVWDGLFGEACESCIPRDWSCQCP